jgi:type I protein arginine methyltransferase
VDRDDGDRPVTSRARARAKRVASRAAARLRASHRFGTVLSRLHNLQYFADLIRHDDMLADRTRVDTYFEAIGRHVRESDEVIDLGTGSGLLACFAAKAGAKLVHALEYGPIIDAARDVAQENGISNITFHPVSSREFSLPHRVDVIVHEQLGAALFNEHVVANVVDLRDRLLKHGGRILPHRLRLFVAPIQADEDLYAPFAWEQTLHGLTFRSLRSYAEARPEGYFYRTYNPFPLGYLLAEPQPVVDVDLLTVTPSALPTGIRYSQSASRDGVLHGFCVFFEARFDEELSITTSPVDPSRAVHWAVPVLRAARHDVHRDDTVSLDLGWTDLAVPATWRWVVEVNGVAVGSRAST